MSDIIIMIMGISIGLSVTVILMGVIYLARKSVKKSKKDMRICLIAISISLVTLAIAFNALNNDNVDRVYGYKIKTANFTNGFNEPIGKYTYIEVDKNKIDNDMLVHIYKTDVEDKGYNWFTVKFDDGTGIQFQGCCMYPVYGDLDNEGCMEGSYIDIDPVFQNETLCGFELHEYIYEQLGLSDDEIKEIDDQYDSIFSSGPNDMNSLIKKYMDKYKLSEEDVRNLFYECDIYTLFK